MTEYLHGSHTIFSIQLHMVWVTKNRKKILNGDIALKARELIREICKKESAEIINGHISSDYVHLVISIRPKTCINDLMQSIKEKTSHTLMMQFESLRNHYSGQEMWTREYFCATSGNVTDDMIKQYIENQNINHDDNFTVE